MNRRSSAISRPAALDAPRTLLKLKAAPLRRIEPAQHEHLLRVLHGVRAVRADCPHEPLGKNAIERRNKVVSLDTHVQKAPQHIDHVIRVDGRKHQMPGQRRVDRNLRSLRIADLAHQNLVGIMAQNRPQSARKREPFFLIHRNLRNAPDLVLDRVLDGDDLVLIGLNFIERRIERCRLARAGRPGHQHHPVRLANIPPEARQIFFRKAHDFQREVAKLLAHRLLIEHAQHGIFAMHRRHDRNAEID